MERREGGLLVAQVHQLGGRVFGRLLREHGAEETSPAQGRILYVLWNEDGLLQSELVARTRLDKSTLALMLKRMEAEGHLERRKDSCDRRVRRIFLSPRSRVQTSRWDKASRAMNSAFYQGIADVDIEVFERVLRQILSNLERAQEGT